MLLKIIAVNLTHPDLFSGLGYGVRLAQEDLSGSGTLLLSLKRQVVSGEGEVKPVLQNLLQSKETDLCRYSPSLHLPEQEGWKHCI